MKWIFFTILIVVIVITVFGIYSQLSERQPSVFWLNFKPESHKILQKLAEQYQERTGRNITIFTPETGIYSETLDALLQSSSPPTLFIVGGKENMVKYNDFFLILKIQK